MRQDDEDEEEVGEWGLRITMIKGGDNAAQWKQKVNSYSPTMQVLRGERKSQRSREKCRGNCGLLTPRCAVRFSRSDSDSTPGQVIE